MHAIHVRLLLETSYYQEVFRSFNMICLTFASRNKYWYVPASSYRHNFEKDRYRSWNKRFTFWTFDNLFTPKNLINKTRKNLVWRFVSIHLSTNAMISPSTNAIGILLTERGSRTIKSWVVTCICGRFKRRACCCILAGIWAFVKINLKVQI